MAIRVCSLACDSANFVMQQRNRKRDGAHIAAIPSWLLAKLISSVTERSSGTTSTNRIAQGQRNQKLASLAGSMQKRDMTLEAIELALLAENRNRCDPPLLDTEVRMIARSIGRYEPWVR